MMPIGIFSVIFILFALIAIFTTYIKSLQGVEKEQVDLHKKKKDGDSLPHSMYSGDTDDRDSPSIYDSYTDSGGSSDGGGGGGGD